LEDDDTNGDGYIDYPEYMHSRTAGEVLSQMEQAKAQQAKP